MKADDFKKMKRLEMVLRPLFFLQEKLDERINARFEMDEHVSSEHRKKKELAFRVEVGELLNALRYHKFWSKKLPEPKERVLEEYVDGLHFLLSMAIDKGIKNYEYKGIYDGELTADDLTFLFDKLMTLPWMDLRKDDFYLGLEMYLKLGEILLFDWEEIKEAYTKKNIENMERQNSGY